MKQILVSIIPIYLLFQSCKTVKFEEYYPAIPNKQMILLFTKDSTDNKLSYKDTLICRLRNGATFRQSKNSSKGIGIVGPNNQVQGGIKPIQFFFFERPFSSVDDSTYIKDNSFAELSYCFYKGRLYMSNVYNRNQNEWNEFFPMIFPKRIRLLDSYFYKYGDMVQTFSFIEKENLEMEGIRYANSLKLAVKKNYNPRAGVDTIWFAKNIGIVKWKKGDGFTGVLQ